VRVFILGEGRGSKGKGKSTLVVAVVREMIWKRKGE
jgi:predicted AAA+ superfamily ATPase